ncbi:hypothetical protein, partial [Vibrio nigripulchritudo]|uniref:hypothetical protein n=1 Tax=Vibrio nigripulchritudo TaxID=28173 RepID=UPI001A7E387C
PWQGCALPTELVSHSQRFRRLGLRIIRAFFCDASPSLKKIKFFVSLPKKETKPIRFAQPLSESVVWLHFKCG